MLLRDLRGTQACLTIDGVTVETSRTYPCCVLKLSTLATIDIVPLTASRRTGGNSRGLFSDYDDMTLLRVQVERVPEIYVQLVYIII